jgi:hypothetical protein
MLRLLNTTNPTYTAAIGAVLATGTLLRGNRPAAAIAAMPTAVKTAWRHVSVIAKPNLWVKSTILLATTIMTTEARLVTPYAVVTAHCGTRWDAGDGGAPPALAAALPGPGAAAGPRARAASSAACCCAAAAASASAALPVRASVA